MRLMGDAQTRDDLRRRRPRRGLEVARLPRAAALPPGERPASGRRAQGHPGARLPPLHRGRLARRHPQPHHRRGARRLPQPVVRRPADRPARVACRTRDTGSSSPTGSSTRGSTPLRSRASSRCASRASSSPASPTPTSRSPRRMPLVIAGGRVAIPRADTVANDDRAGGGMAAAAPARPRPHPLGFVGARLGGAVDAERASRPGSRTAAAARDRRHHGPAGRTH